MALISVCDKCKAANGDFYTGLKDGEIPHDRLVTSMIINGFAYDLCDVCQTAILKGLPTKSKPRISRPFTPEPGGSVI